MRAEKGGLSTKLGALERRVADMAELARGMLKDGVKALVELDSELGQQVYDRRERLAEQDEQIEHELLQFLILQNPMASDLRRVGAALKLITYLNRLGRYGSDIARTAQKWPEGRGHLAKLVNIQDMAEKVQHMLDIVLQAYADRAEPGIEHIEELESEVDALRASVWREALTYMAEDPKNIEPCANYMMVARYLERCGDNICKIAEKQYYAATGERILIG